MSEDEKQFLTEGEERLKFFNEWLANDCKSKGKRIKTLMHGYGVIDKPKKAKKK